MTEKPSRAENIVRAVASYYGATDVRLVVNEFQYEDFKKAGLPESMMVRNQKLPMSD